MLVESPLLRKDHAAILPQDEASTFNLIENNQLTLLGNLLFQAKTPCLHSGLKGCFHFRRNLPSHRATE